MGKSKIIIISSSIIAAICLVLYFGIVFGLPAIINSSGFSATLEKLILDKTGITTDIDDLKINVSPKLSGELYFNEFKIFNNKKTAAQITKFQADIDLKKLSLKKIHSDYVSVDINSLQEVLPKKKKTSSKSFNMDKLPELEINKINIIVQPKQKLILNNIKIAKNNKGELIINTKNIPVKPAMAVLLYYQKSNDKSKKFIENFENYSGRIDLALVYKNKSLSGMCCAKELSANTVLFNVPVYFKNAKFTIKNNTMTSRAEGVLGGEKVVHTLYITNLMSKKRIVNGEVTSTLTERLVNKYLPEEYGLKKTAGVKVKYRIQNKIPVVQYFVNLEKGSDILYKDAYLGIRDKNRKLYAKTVKTYNGLRLEKYEYSMFSGGKKSIIITGEGFFLRKNNKLTPQYITCRTNGYAPAYVTGSFGKYVQGGQFKGRLKYDFILDKITGNFELINTVFKKFCVHSAMITATINNLNIKANGCYNRQDFHCEMNAQNRLDGIFNVRDMNLFLEEFIIKGQRNKTPEVVQHNHHKDFDKQIENVSSKIRNIDMTIEKWDIKAGSLYIDDIVIRNPELYGSLRNSIFKFTLADVGFANGLLKAKGQYSFKNNSSDINFTASDIDSNEAAILLFELPNQINGIAQAKLHVQTFDKFKTLCAKGSFKVDNGFLPQLGDTEFMLGKKGKKHKFKINNLTNIDFSRKKILSSNLKGTFDVCNYDLKNINITSQQSFMSLFIDGHYNLKTRQTLMNIYGKYDAEAPKGVKILFVPLNWILKLVLKPENSRELYKAQLNKIPPVSGRAKTVQYFRVNVRGDLNSNNLKVVLKKIK